MKNTVAEVIRIVGWVSLIGALIYGIACGVVFKVPPETLSGDPSFNWVLMFVVTLSSAVSSLLWFGASELIELVSDINDKLRYLSGSSPTIRPNISTKTVESNVSTKTCSSCKKEYGENLSSCPHCGFRDDAPVSMKTCSACSQKYSSNRSTCPHCGSV